MKHVLLFMSVCVASGVLFVNVYNSVVDARSWGSDIPNSISTARSFYKVANPGDFFRVVSPVCQALALIALVVFWKSHPSLRLYLGTAFVLYVLGDVFTFVFFYPRNALLFKDAVLTDVALLKRVWGEWATVNWIRSGVVLTGLIFSCVSLFRSMQR
jgi:hypothetical protein